MAMEARERINAHLAEADLSGGPPAPAPATALLQGTVEQFEKVINLERNLLRKSITKLQHDLQQIDTELNMKEEEMVIWEQRLLQIHQDNEVKLRMARARVESKKYGQKTDGAHRTSAAQSPSALGFIAEGDEDSECEDELEGTPTTTPGCTPAPTSIEPAGAPDTPPRGKGAPSLDAQRVNELAKSVNEEISVLRRRWQQLVDASQVRPPPDASRPAVRSTASTPVPTPPSSNSDLDRQQNPIWDTLKETRRRDLMREMQPQSDLLKDSLRNDGSANMAAAFAMSSSQRHPSRPSVPAEPIAGDAARRQHLAPSSGTGPHLSGSGLTPGGPGQLGAPQQPIVVGRSVTGDTSGSDASAGVARFVNRGETQPGLRQPGDSLDGSPTTSMPSAIARGVGYASAPSSGGLQSNQHDLAQRGLRPASSPQAISSQPLAPQSRVPVMPPGGHPINPGAVGQRAGYPQQPAGYGVGTPQIQMPPQYPQGRTPVPQRPWHG